MTENSKKEDLRAILIDPIKCDIDYVRIRADHQLEDMQALIGGNIELFRRDDVGNNIEIDYYCDEEFMLKMEDPDLGVVIDGVLYAAGFMLRQSDGASVAVLGKALVTAADSRTGEMVTLPGGKLIHSVVRDTVFFRTEPKDIPEPTVEVTSW